MSRKSERFIDDSIQDRIYGSYIANQRLTFRGQEERTKELYELQKEFRLTYSKHKDNYLNN